MTQNKLICPAENLSVWVLTNFKDSKEEEDGLIFKAGIMGLVKVWKKKKWLEPFISQDSPEKRNPKLKTQES